MLRSHFPEIDPAGWQTLYYPSRKGEDITGVHDRAGATLSTLVPVVETRFEGKHKRVLLVSHAATVIALARELMGDREMPLRVGTCTLTDMRRKTSGSSVVGGWEMVKAADGAHLNEGSLRDWGFEDSVFVDGQVKIVSRPPLDFANVLVGCSPQR